MNARLRGMSIKTGNQAQMYRSPLKHRLLVRMVIASVGLALLVGSARAEEPSVTAVLTSSEATVGQDVQLQIQVKGDRNVAPPTEISVDGLEIHPTGQDLYVLKWFTPLEGLNSDCLAVVRDGKSKVPYDGPMIKRGKPSPHPRTSLDVDPPLEPV